MYSTAQISDAAYVIGGWYTENVVAEFKNGEWRKLSNLNQGRSRHGSITIGSKTMVIGGADDWPNGDKEKAIIHSREIK